MQLSASKITTFRQCPLKYKLRYINRVPAQPKAFMRFGSIVHAALRRFYAIGERECPSLELWREEYRKFWNIADDPSVIENPWYKRGEEILEEFYHETKDNYQVPAMLEQRFKAYIGAHVLIGKFDRVDFTLSGGYEIIDYKLSKEMLTREEAENDLQLALYALAFHVTDGIVPEQVSFYFVRHCQKVSVHRDEGQIADTFNLVERIAAEINQCGKFSPIETDKCPLCDYSEYCPAKVASPRKPDSKVWQRELSFYSKDTGGAGKS